MQLFFCFTGCMKGGINMITVSRKQISIPFEERIICCYGDNDKDIVTFEINENDSEGCNYYLYILFPDDRVNSIMLEENNGALVWNVRAEHIFTSGIAYIQIKSVGLNGEIWHSPKATVEFLESLDMRETSNFTPSLYQQLDNRVNEIYSLAESFGESVREYTEEIIMSLADSDYITRTEAVQLINETIDDLLLPLNRRLDGEIPFVEG